jgi:SAM-dependent methyltransferase
MQRIVARELMDDPVESLAELEGNLRDIAFTNAVFNGTGPVLRAVRASGATSVLDVGSGLADVPLALVRDARRRGIEMRVTCLDRSEQMLALARKATRDHPWLDFVHGEGEALPYPDEAFDVVMCNLALHHFEPPAAERLLRELRRVSKITPLMCDVSRSRLAYVASRLWTTVATRNRLTRHDGPLSIRRAYTPLEALALARGAGWNAPVLETSAFFRMTLTDASP